MHYTGMIYWCSLLVYRIQNEIRSVSILVIPRWSLSSKGNIIHVGRYMFYEEYFNECIIRFLNKYNLSDDKLSPASINITKFIPSRFPSGFSMGKSVVIELCKIHGVYLK